MTPPPPLSVPPGMILGSAFLANKIDAAVALGRKLGQQALYFGCWNGPGHYLHMAGGKGVSQVARDYLVIPWSDSIMDGTLLKNGKHPDIYDGKVYWTCGGIALWYAFFWWDNSVDSRKGSNSGFYVRGFGWPETQAAFDYACATFPKVIARQRQPLILQAPR